MGFRGHRQLAQKYKGFQNLLLLFSQFPYLDQLHYPSLQHSLAQQLILVEFLEDLTMKSEHLIVSEVTSLFKFLIIVSYFNVTKFDYIREAIYFDRDKSYHTIFQVLLIAHKLQYQRSTLKIFHRQYLI